MGELQQELERRGKGHLVSEETAQHEQAAGQHNEGPHVALFVAVEAGRDKEPHLPEDVRRRQENPAHHGQLDVEIEGVGWIVIDQSVGITQTAQRLGQRPGHVAVNRVPKVEANAGPDQDGGGAAQEARAKLLEVLEERHLPAAKLLFLRFGSWTRRGWVLNGGRHTWAPPRSFPPRGLPRGSGRGSRSVAPGS